MGAWLVELFEFDINFVSKSNIKSQALQYFLAEFSMEVEAEAPCLWTLSVDEFSNLKGSGTRIILEGPCKVLLEQPLCFGFQASNNQTEYKALIDGMNLAQKVGVINLYARSDSQLVTN